MKKRIRVIAFVLVMVQALAMPAYAAGGAAPRESAYFSSYGTFLYKTDSRTIQIWFDVDSNGATMDIIGASVIELYRSKDQQSWTLMTTYEMADFPQMVDDNTGSHTGYVTYYNGAPGYYYTAYVTFYAKKGTGTGERYVYTSILKM